jgi:hypothetical protein
MRRSGWTADTAPMLRWLLLVSSALALVGFSGIGFWYVSTQPTQPSGVERVVACIQKLGYSAYSHHDDGVEPLTGQDPDIMVLLGGEYQARPPSDHVIVNHRYGTADVTVPDNDVPLEIVDHGDPLTAGERVAVAGCARR